MNLIKKIKKVVPAPVKSWLVAKLTKKHKHSSILVVTWNPLLVGSVNAAEQPKRALLSYITAPFRLLPNDPLNIRFSNIGIARSIVQSLSELNYVTDIVEYTDKEFIPGCGYDLFIGHGGDNFRRIANLLPVSAPKIYYSSGCYWKFHNNQELSRLEALRRRRRVKLRPDRWIAVSEEWANENADAIICLGNNSTYSRFPVVFKLNNAAFYDDRYNQTKKDFLSARKNFLFFTGGGNVHKGLDLLLEAFTGLDAHLYICQRINPDFFKIYRSELTAALNIHLIGVIPMRSPQFYELIDRCAFVINPSCAEGQPGGVVECMHQGLIPVVSRESNIDTGDYGILLEPCSIKNITEIVNNLSRRSPEWCSEMSAKTRRIAITEFSETFFLQNMKKAIQCIVTKQNSNNINLTCA